MIALSILILGFGVVVVAIVADYIRNKRYARLIQRSIQQTDHHLKRSNQVENELQQEIGSLRARVDELLQDPVTHLPAWPLFADRVLQVIRECERYQLVMGILYVDINDFQTINSALGNHVGDDFLREVARRLQICIRQSDLISRQSKDVFVILLARLAKPETAVVVAQRVLYELSQPFEMGSRGIGITANIGLALYPNDGQDVETLLLRAEQALQLSKETGKQGFQFYHGELQQRAQRELAIFSSLSHGTMLRELKISFQPIMDVHNEVVYGVDTSLRWEHPEIGILSAHEIFSYAERQNKLSEVSEWFLRSAVKEFASWQMKGLSPKLLSIPLAVKSIESTHFLQKMAHILKELAFDAKALVVEVPESFSHSSFEILEKSFNILHYLGVKIALDHFGAGSLALRYLKAYPFDYLRLEPLLVDDLVANKRTQQLLQSVLSLANNLNLKVIAQGVESQEQVTALKEIGYHLIEGPVFGEAIFTLEKAGALLVE